MRLRSLLRTLAVLLGVATLTATFQHPAYAVGEGEAFDPSTCAAFRKNTPSQAWQVSRLHPERAWPIATGKGVRIAVIDTGIDTVENPALTRNNRPLITESHNFAGYDKVKGQGTRVSTDCQHGTQVASLIVGHTDDRATNFSGIAPDATVISLRALQQTKAEQPEPLEPTVKAIQKAIELRVNVINISQQGSDTPEYRQAIRSAINAGIVVVAAAGNLGGQNVPPPFPAAYPGVIAVGMSTVNDVAEPRSQYHRDLQVSVAAPGEQVLLANPSEQHNQSWQADTGTSYAAPIVSAVVALILEKYPDLTPAQVRQRLESSADPPRAAVPDRQLGYGIVNPYAALTVISGNSTPGPSPVPTGSAPHPMAAQRDSLGPRLGALGIGVVAIGLTAVAIAVSMAYPFGQKRSWKA
ncbi:S8 family serine peptidase [Granulicoccus phenolivorans]|uniref:S8 family serine peptidase n=1 Tax=Granulicoccus phenolivorans TaxID=266854 RepID=UPI0004018553|nr:S8 family serine peptidase [Granulicoccus phenolivorans]